MIENMKNNDIIKQVKLLEWLCSIKIEPKKKEIKLKRDRSEKK